MASAAGNDIEVLVREKVEEELKNIGMNRSGVETREMSKATKEVTAALLPDIANIITVVVTTAVANAVKKITREVIKCNNKVQKSFMLNKYDNDKLEQYMRRDNLCISGIKEERYENEMVLETKIINIASDIGVELEPRDISITHRLGKPRGSDRPVIVRFCHRKKRDEVMKKRKALKNKQESIYINDDSTPLRVSLLKMVKDHSDVKNATTADG
ncbi:hypothetical protein Pmani_013255 [Petrolisthes manimaculis]|uniref:Uncharacterized protein n=1 Tax=Petrolisthes manimaculis TaxID=1843537 RepID=A0AAE1PWD9_9EUCA|nr:hypothetical protein Pmani_013255 [Petrolisthes manimaculis]